MNDHPCSDWLLFSAVTGEGIQTVHCFEVEARGMAARMGLGCRAISSGLGLVAVYVDTQRDVLVSVPAQPDPHHVFDWVEKVWRDPRDLRELQDAKWDEIRAARNAQEATSFPYMGKDIDSNLVSVLRINTVVKAAEHALLNQREFAIVWTCADNSLLSLDAQGMIGMPLALAAYAERLHEAGAALRLAIYAEENLGFLANIKWNPNV